MSRCTAPVRGHIRGGGEDCPVCGPRYRGFRSSYTPSYTPSYPSPSPSASWSSGGSRSSSGGGRSSRNTKPRWSGAGSSQLYTPEEVRALTPIRETVEKRAAMPDLRQIFLCHAWDDRLGAAKELYDLLVARGVSVWFSENDIGLGEPFLRAIDKGLAKSRIGIVLVTPSMLKRLPAGGVADKELSVLLQRDQIVPIIHNTSYDALRDVSPMLASRNGLDTAEMPMADVAAKLAELVAVPIAA
ncbi:TIR domain protein [Bradyrhizobium sp. CCBAU 11430]|nr:MULTISPECIES: toll/interleukin-1 receptor domain-containing protein [unclassified Bradyrhizobium]MDA9415110.1 TIR domain protein [Bradyrhizobium sp. CCBAU 25360]MDA9448713.1 TIR domain protein [Bradyrhizobium sp. CCBAU 21360]MDA9454017.1 TIR domain protein [Bradyrhizobium sp. CCBAU 21359]MDA9515029.1 TIR domain protein [Bradyrhizobium sp. CCBAU 11430]